MSFSCQPNRRLKTVGTETIDQTEAKETVRIGTQTADQTETKKTGLEKKKFQPGEVGVCTVPTDQRPEIICLVPEGQVDSLGMQKV